MQVMSRLAPGNGYQDDVALLLYRQPGPLEVELPAEASHLASTRAALKGWLSAAGVDADQTLKVLIATGEALANAIEHGHRLPTPGTISLRATALADRVHVTVVDAGTWKPPVAAAHRGRGIALMRALMQDVTIQSRATGTTVHMYSRIA
jgi:anti-sigma regulatory factor (Ser/Thr protein kinase)